VIDERSTDVVRADARLRGERGDVVPPVRGATRARVSLDETDVIDEVRRAMDKQDEFIWSIVFCRPISVEVRESIELGMVVLSVLVKWCL
jgi:hypothetical protein